MLYIIKVITKNHIDTDYYSFYNKDPINRSELKDILKNVIYIDDEMGITFTEVDIKSTDEFNTMPMRENYELLRALSTFIYFDEINKKYIIKYWTEPKMEILNHVFNTKLHIFYTRQAESYGSKIVRYKNMINLENYFYINYDDINEGIYSLYTKNCTIDFENFFNVLESNHSNDIICLVSPSDKFNALELISYYETCEHYPDLKVFLAFLCGNDLYVIPSKEKAIYKLTNTSEVIQYNDK